jgi:hypothetical protein
MTIKWICIFLALGVGIAVGWMLPWTSAQEAALSQPPVNAPVAPEATNSASPLATLDWLAGSWAGKTENGAVEFSCKFTKNDAFLVRSFRIVNQSETSMSGMQVIAWDPSQEAIRSWTFDSNGGFGEDIWTQADDRYTMRSKYILPDGGTGSAINVMTFVDNDTFQWKSTNREIDGELQPDTDDVVISRVSDGGSDETNPVVEGGPNQ